MFVELIEMLRCPRLHADSQLVVAATRTESRHVVAGVLGCPVCNAEFRIEHGIAHFDAPSETGPEPGHAGVDDVVRIAAFLDLTDARGFALLHGRWSAHAPALSRLVQTPLVLVNPPGAAMSSDAAGVTGVIIVGGRLPFAQMSSRAIALDERAPAPLVDSAVRVLRAGGRMVAPLVVGVPPGIAEIARDGALWIGEKTAAGAEPPRLVSLSRARG